jgi:anti-sigma-K factor RskA
MMIIMMKKPKIWPDKDLELWAIPQTGAQVPIGLLLKRQGTLME